LEDRSRHAEGSKSKAGSNQATRKKAGFALGLMSRKGFHQCRKNFGGENQNECQRKTSGGRKADAGSGQR
jgi:hypothetical protein